MPVGINTAFAGQRLVVVTSPRMLDALAGAIGMGQLFKHFDAFPVFTLLEVNRGHLPDPELLLAKHSCDGESLIEDTGGGGGSSSTKSTAAAVI